MYVATLVQVALSRFITKRYQVQVVETVGTWYKIRFGTGYGYVAKHYVVQNQPQAKTDQPSSIPVAFKFLLKEN